MEILEEIAPAPAPATTAPPTATTRSRPLTGMFADVTTTTLEQQAAQIMKARAMLTAKEEEEARRAVSSTREAIRRRMSTISRGIGDSFAITRGTIQRSLSGTRSSTAIRRTLAAANAPQEEKRLRLEIQTRLLEILTTTEQLDAVAAKLVTLYTDPQFPSQLFDEQLSLWMVESILDMIPAPVTSSNPLRSPPPRRPQPAVGQAFKEARDCSEERTTDLWNTLCTNRRRRDQQGPTFLVKRRVLVLGIMAQLWPRGVMELGWRRPGFLRCEMDSWAFNFCAKPTNETLGCGLWVFLRNFGMWREDQEQPTADDLRQNGIEARDWADYRPTAMSTLR